MHETLANALNLSPDRRACSRRVMEETGQLMMDSSISILMYLASGKADWLSGRHIGWRQSEEELTSRADEIEKDNLFVLRLRT